MKAVYDEAIDGSTVSDEVFGIALHAHDDCQDSIELFGDFYRAWAASVSVQLAFNNPSKDTADWFVARGIRY